jgi:predicted DNA-binding transcriptional regulator AlpA
MSETTENLIDTEEAAAVVGLRPQTLVAYRHEGRGPRFYKIGRRCLYRRADLLAFIEAQAVEPEAKPRRKVA